MSTIVIGVTSVGTALEACRRGLELAQSLDAQVHLVYALDERDAGADSKARRHAEGLLESISLATNRPTKVHALAGPPDAVILSVAESTNADMIVLGNQGLSGSRYVGRTVQAKVLRDARCAVLVVDTA